MKKTTFKFHLADQRGSVQKTITRRFTDFDVEQLLPGKYTGPGGYFLEEITPPKDSAWDRLLVEYEDGTTDTVAVAGEVLWDYEWYGTSMIIPMDVYLEGHKDNVPPMWSRRYPWPKFRARPEALLPPEHKLAPSGICELCGKGIGCPIGHQALASA